MGETRVTVPDIGDATDVDVVEVLVKPGTRVEREQSLIVLESDKASMEIPSPEEGVVKRILVAVGDKVSQGGDILLLEVDVGDAAVDVAAAPATGAPTDGADGAVETPDAETPADRQPVVQTQAPASSTEPVRTIPPASSSSAAGPSAPPAAKPPGAHAGPAVRRFARELGVDLTHVPGTGRKQRITKEDVQHYVKHAMGVAAAPPTGGLGSALTVDQAPSIDFSQFGETETQPLTKIQRVSGRNLHRSWLTIPHVTQFDSADITELEAFRKKMRQDRPDVKLTLLSFFMKAVVIVLRQMPRFNASLDESGENLVLKRYFHIGVAVDTPNGLVVPVIRDVDIKGLGELAEELTLVSERARARKLSPRDMQGGSMTISSLGGIGGTAFTPIINPPEVAVLGVSRAALQPVYRDGQLQPRLMCPLSLSYDHRVIDGAAAARFTSRLGDVLGDIREMLL